LRGIDPPDRLQAGSYTLRPIVAQIDPGAVDVSDQPIAARNIVPQLRERFVALLGAVVEDEIRAADGIDEDRRIEASHIAHEPGPVIIAIGFAADLAVGVALARALDEA